MAQLHAAPRAEGLGPAQEHLEAHVAAEGAAVERGVRRVAQHRRFAPRSRDHGLHHPLRVAIERRSGIRRPCHVGRVRTGDDEPLERPGDERGVHVGEVRVGPVTEPGGRRDGRAAQAIVGGTEAVALEPGEGSGAGIAGLSEAVEQHEERHLRARGEVPRDAQREAAPELRVAGDRDVADVEIGERARGELGAGGPRAEPDRERSGGTEEASTTEQHIPRRHARGYHRS